MERIVAPGRYIRYAGCIARTAELARSLGERILVAGGRRALDAAWPGIEDSLREARDRAAGKDGVVQLAGVEWYGGECSHAHAEGLAQKIIGSGADVLIGVGGGKALDTAKLAARLANVPLIVVPTIAATCAAWTALSVMYGDDGKFTRNEYNVRNPEYVVVDPSIIARAPERLLLSGIGDTLSKWFEVDITATKAGLSSTALSARALGRACYEILRRDAVGALAAVRRQQVSDALEQVIDAIIMVSGMVSGIGGVECRTAGAHAIYLGMTCVDRTHRMYHGELVAFGLIAMLAMMGESKRAEIQEVIDFNRACGLPVTLEEVGLGDLSDEELDRIAAKALQTEEIRNMPFEITSELIRKSILQADQLGKEALRVARRIAQKG